VSAGADFRRAPAEVQGTGRGTSEQPKVRFGPQLGMLSWGLKPWVHYACPAPETLLPFALAFTPSLLHLPHPRLLLSNLLCSSSRSFAFFILFMLNQNSQQSLAQILEIEEDWKHGAGMSAITCPVPPISRDRMRLFFLGMLASHRIASLQ
jgi:hypothetical protein